MPKRANLALAACDGCRQRKVRCDGVRPKCGACERRNTDCAFQSDPTLTRTAALKSEVSQLKTNRNGLLELYRQLKEGTASDAWRLVEQIRSGERLIDSPPLANAEKEGTFRPSPRSSELVDAFDTATSSHCGRLIQPTTSLGDVQGPTFQFAGHNANLQASFANVEVDPGVVEAPLTVARSGSMDASPYLPMSDLDLGTAIYVETSDASLHYSLQANLTAIQDGFEIQQSCISEVFLCHDKDTFEALTASLKQDLGILLAVPTSSMLCEICAAAAVAGQYVRDSLAPGLLDYWYGSARQRFGDCMEVAPVSAIRVAAMLGLYNLLGKPGLAITFFETGLSLSTRYMEEHAVEDGLLSDHEMSTTVHTRESIVFCSGWLQATLGYNISSTTKVSLTLGHKGADVLKVVQDTKPYHISEHDRIRGVVSTIAVLKATAMRMLWACSDVPRLLHSIHDLQERFSTWYEDLPDAAHIRQLGGDMQIPVKMSVYYVHLLHLGAVMLMFRHCLAGLQFPRDRESLSAEQRSTMNAALNDGLQAAQQSARMTYLMQQVSHSVRHYWTTIYQAYVSGMILVYNAAQLRLSGLSKEKCALSFDLAGKVVDSLDFCKELDPVSRKLTTSLTEHYQCLRDANPPSPPAGSDRLAGTEQPQSGDYLFHASPENEALHDTACELFERLCNPYTDECATVLQPDHTPGPWPQPSRRSSFSWRFRCSEGYMGSGFGEAPAAITPEISNLEDGYFVGLREPSWWLAMRSLAAHVG